jgi:hypothetical protein
VFDIEYKDQFIIWLSKDAKLKIGKKKNTKIYFIICQKKQKKNQKNKKIISFTNYQVYTIIADTANAPATSSLSERERERERELTNNNATKLYTSSRTFCLISNHT